MNKKTIRFTLNIPGYMFDKLLKIAEESPSNTMTGTILQVLEKGINWHEAKWKKARQSDNPGFPGSGQDPTVDQENNITIDPKSKEDLEHIQEIIHTRWID